MPWLQCGVSYRLAPVVASTNLANVLDNNAVCLSAFTGALGHQASSLCIGSGRGEPGAAGNKQRVSTACRKE